VRPGELVAPGQPLGELEILGRLATVVVSAGVAGRVLPEDGRFTARRPVGFGDALLRLEAVGSVSAASAASEARSDASEGLFFRAPSAGRFYLRPAPDKEPFIRVGDVLERGRLVGLLEVMKTFNRLTYGGSAAGSATELPERATVLEILASEGSDIAEGDPLLRLGAA
jgi:acetyl-CoA carboxylase biotin carboxyl carrier protein